MLTHARRATLALTTTAALALGTTTAPAQAAGADVTPQAGAAAAWLADELHDGLIVDEFQDPESKQWFQYTDHGLTLDVFFALKELGVKGTVRRGIISAMEAETGAYITNGDYRYAGATGKLLTAVLARGLDPSTYSDYDLVAELEALVHTEADAQQGRASDTYDATDPWQGDYSNTVGQSFVVRGLAGVGSELADETVRFLLKQQCAEGFFRVSMESVDHTCDAGTAKQSAPSVDATASAVMALLEVQRIGVEGVREAKVDAALQRAGKWLVTKQADNGAFRDAGVANSNSTGLAAQALAALGRVRPAVKAAAWLSSLQVTGKLVRTTAFRERDRGAVAPDRAALVEGEDEGITRDVRYRWHRSTAQAAVGLDYIAP